MQNKLHIFNHFGKMEQKKKLFEENVEFQDALYKWSANPTRENYINMVDEWNDIGAILKQFGVAEYSVPEEEINAMARNKEQRTLDIISKCRPGYDPVSEYNRVREEMR